MDVDAILVITESILENAANAAVQTTGEWATIPACGSSFFCSSAAAMAVVPVCGEDQMMTADAATTAVSGSFFCYSSAAAAETTAVN